MSDEAPIPLGSSEDLFSDAWRRARALIAVRHFQKQGMFPELEVKTSDFRQAGFRFLSEVNHPSRAYEVTYQAWDFGPTITAGIGVAETAIHPYVMLDHLMYLRGEKALRLSIIHAEPVKELNTTDSNLRIEGRAFSFSNGIPEAMFSLHEDRVKRSLTVLADQATLFGMQRVFERVFHTEVSIPEIADWPAFCLSLPAVRLLDEERLRRIFERWPLELPHLWTDLDGVGAMRELSLRIVEMNGST